MLSSSDCDSAYNGSFELKNPFLLSFCATVIANVFVFRFRVNAVETNLPFTAQDRYCSTLNFCLCQYLSGCLTMRFADLRISPGRKRSTRCRSIPSSRRMEKLSCFARQRGKLLRCQSVSPMIPQGRARNLPISPPCVEFSSRE